MSTEPTFLDALPGLLFFGFVSVVGILAYFLPFAIAVIRKRPNMGGIAVVNLLTGWTMIGWVIALVMACMPNEQRMVVTHR